MSGLLDPVRIGAWELANRIVMAPLTRCRASQGRVPNELMLEYYVQRAGAGLIITEATSISAMGVGYPDTPGIWSEDKVAGWKRITQAVHNVGGRIISQFRPSRLYRLSGLAARGSGLIRYELFARVDSR